MANDLWAVIAPTGFREETEKELSFKKLRPVAQQEDFFLLAGEPRPVAWAAVTWLKVERLPFASITEGARLLRPLAKRWALQPLAHHRRATLIFEQLRGFRRVPARFPVALSLEEGVGAFALLEPSEILWCRQFDRPDPAGQLEFAENKAAPPSRAYLKLWEACALSGAWPASGELCLDLGASPGGWTWALAALGARVLSVDRAPLAPAIAGMPGVTFRKGDAFQATPEAVGAVDWLCSDVICVPEKLRDLVGEWIAADKARHFVCTLKFQGAADPATVAQFERWGRVLHLHHNKHELTFLR